MKKPVATSRILHKVRPQVLMEYTNLSKATINRLVKEDYFREETLREIYRFLAVLESEIASFKREFERREV